MKGPSWHLFELDVLIGLPFSQAGITHGFRHRVRVCRIAIITSSRTRRTLLFTKFSRGTPLAKAIVVDFNPDSLSEQMEMSQRTFGLFNNAHRSAGEYGTSILKDNESLRLLSRRTAKSQGHVSFERKSLG
jgi:hypothetical protein